MKNRFVVFSEPETVEILEEPMSDALAPDSILVRSEYTCISAGTECANFFGDDPAVFREGSWCAYPWRPGYAQVGIVEAVGSGVTEHHPGDRVFTLGNHAEYVMLNAESLVIPVPEALDPIDAVASRMAGVAASAFVASPPAWFAPNWCVVLGLGMVGNLAAQCYRALGANVIGADPVEGRRQLAERCGILHTVESIADDLQSVLAITGGERPQTIIEATGRSDVILQALDALADHGHCVLLGTPRVPYEGDLTGLLSQIHLRNLNLHGALEWSLPKQQPDPFYNTCATPVPNLISKQKRLFDWILDGRLSLRPLVSHVLKPGQAEEAYHGLREKSEQYTGVLFDWR